MKKISLLILLLASITFSCKDDLALENPNSPTPNSLSNETGIISFATGGIYLNGFKDLKYTDGVYGPFWSGALGFHELMGDVIGADAANAYLNQLGCPESVTFDNGTVVKNPNSPNTQIALIRQSNSNQQAGNNFLYYEWAYMYNLISACNLLLEKAEEVEFQSEAESKKAAIKSWAYWWKGYAYSRIGSTYYAGLILNEYGSTNNNYVTKEAIIAESNKNLDLAVSSAKSAPNSAAYLEILGKIIPAYFQKGKGLPQTAAELERNVNTLKARNLFVNKTTASMSASDWGQIITLTDNGIKLNDNVFTIRTDAIGNLFTAGQTVMGRTQSNNPGSATYKLSERWVQEFKDGDKRKQQNVKIGTPYLGQADRGNAHFTRYSLLDKGTGLPGVVVFANTTPGELEIYAAGTYEENQLMKAEALINTGKINEGLAIVDQIRTLQGADLPAVANANLSLADAKEELRRERRIVLAFRGLSFYDARRWGVINSLANGGGRKNAVLVSNKGEVSTNGSILYNYLDYWDVPANETVYNPPSESSAPVVNPKN